jgi:hypothetical protein
MEYYLTSVDVLLWGSLETRSVYASHHGVGMTLPQVADGWASSKIRGCAVHTRISPAKEVYHGAVINLSPRHIRKQNQLNKKGKLVEKVEWKRQFEHSSVSYFQVYSRR